MSDAASIRSHRATTMPAGGTAVFSPVLPLSYRYWFSVPVRRPRRLSGVAESISAQYMTISAVAQRALRTLSRRAMLPDDNYSQARTAITDARKKWEH